jgi:hypothetical protein
MFVQNPQTGQVVQGYYITAYRNLTTVSISRFPHLLTEALLCPGSLSQHVMQILTRIQ